MRNIIKNIRLPIDGTTMDFRLTKLDAFSGVYLLRLLSKMEDEGLSGSGLFQVITNLPQEELKTFMTSCMNHVEVLLPAGYQPVMQGSSWSWAELEHDTANCLKLAIEEISWTLSGFFGDGGSPS